MKRVLFIDDEHVRHSLVDCVAESEKVEVIHAYNIDEAFKLLDAEYDLISIDHDLQEIKRNGTLIAKKMCEMEKNIPLVWVHSMNPVGATHIKAILTNCEGVQGIIQEPFNIMTITKVFQYLNEGK